jgi:large subunit ribosomal protein L3
MQVKHNMSIGLVGKKCGMSRIFTEQGESIPVTLIEATPNRITQVKREDHDGYSAVQVTAGTRRASLLNKPQKGHFAKARVEPGHGLWEFRVGGEDAGNYEVGGEIKAADVFEAGQTVDVAGVSKGKGFAGAVKRHHFRTQDATHGNSLSHRAPGSIGQNQTPGRVFPGKKMAGQMGAVKRTQQGLEIVRVDAERHLIAIKGAVPGATGGEVIIRATTKGS